MHKENKKWNYNEQEFQTLSNRSRIGSIMKLAKKLSLDEDILKRRGEQICKLCYYKVEGALFAFTDTSCGKCKKELTFPSSNVDRLCFECAKVTESCKHCGGELD